MAFELKEGQGTLFANDKEGNDKRPDRRGELNIGGTVYRLSGWIKQGKNGPWLSLSAELPRRDPVQPTEMAKRMGETLPDDIPF